MPISCLYTKYETSHQLVTCSLEVGGNKQSSFVSGDEKTQKVAAPGQEIVRHKIPQLVLVTLGFLYRNVKKTCSGHNQASCFTSITVFFIS